MDLSFLRSRYVFLGLLGVFAFSFFGRNDLKSVDRISPEALRQPVQLSSSTAATIAFRKDGYAYTLTPLYRYEISGMVASKMDYRIFSLSRSDKVFPVDLCLIWGDNLRRKVHKAHGLSFSQDCRWCWVEWRGDVQFNFDELSNNHLLVNTPAIERQLRHIGPGDQVVLRGSLVNVKARLYARQGEFEPAELVWNTSTTRSDTGAGACEVIYLEELRILREAHPVLRRLFSLSGTALLALAFWSAAAFFFGKPRFC